MPDSSKRRFIVVSNRLPISIKRDETGELTATQGAGGLVTALAPVLRNRGGTWVGWPGTTQEGVAAMCQSFSKDAGYFLRPVELADDEVDGFYRGFSNEILWPLFHEFQMPCNFLPKYWETYRAANQKFARAAAEAAAGGDFIWVHDYHLMLVAKQLKEAGVTSKTGFFLHIPFPPADIFLKIPWRLELIKALLEYDLIGFQTVRDRRNFLDVVRRIDPTATRRGRGQVLSLYAGERVVRVGAFPIGIDFASFVKTASTAACQEGAEEIRQAFGHRFLLFGADRLDYTKGVPQRLDALRATFERHPDLRGKISLIQVVVPSREDVPQYRAMKEEIERMVGEISGQYSMPGWSPVHFVYRNLPREELVSYYMAADMALVTPLRDGMNLVAKEYAACNVGETGILCLSEFAGAAMELHRYALVVNPFDVNGVADAIEAGVLMDRASRRRRMHLIRSILRRYDIFRWVDAFLDAAFAMHLEDFPSARDAWDAPDAVQGPPWDLPREG